MHGSGTLIHCTVARDVAQSSGPALQARSTHAHAHAVANTKEKEERAHGGQKSIGNCCLKERPTAGKDTSDRLVTRGFRAFERPVPFLIAQTGAKRSRRCWAHEDAGASPGH